MNNRICDKYLAQHAETEIQSLHELIRQAPIPSLLCSIVIPAFNESFSFVSRFLNNKALGEALFILIINAPDSARETRINQQLFNKLLEKGTRLANKNNLWLLQIEETFIVVANRFSQNKIPTKQGVGLARKIGCDIAVWFYQHKITSSPWIYSSDADTTLPENYLTYAQKSPKHSAAVFNFKHTSEATTHEIAAATQTYETALKYYCTLLAWAKSPFAFYTLGSTLAVNVFAYCQVRGFPKRAGGEDFYLLNKLAKVGQITYEHNIVMLIESRCSDRVPFGTGPAVSKIIALNQSNTPYCYYNPAIFQELKTLLCIVPTLWPIAHGSLALEDLLPDNILNTLARLGFNKFLSHAAKQAKSQKVFEKSFNDWFDAFMTLKFIHDMQNHYYPPLPLEQCLSISENIRSNVEH